MADEKQRAPTWEDFIGVSEETSDLNVSDADVKDKILHENEDHDVAPDNVSLENISSSDVGPFDLALGKGFQDLSESSQRSVEDYFYATETAITVSGPSTNNGQAGIDFESPQKQRIMALLKAFERIGAPLITAVSEVQSWSGPESQSPEQDAELLAQLISTTVSVSQKVADRIGAQQHPDADWVRWAVAAVMSPVVATQYRVTGKALNDREAARIVSTVDAVAAFASDYTEGKFGRDALEFSDDYVAGLHIKAVNALVPVIGAIARFSFGHSEQALIREVLVRLKEKVDTVTDRLLDASVNEDEHVRFELGILNAAGQLYAECHYAEMDRLLDMSAEDRSDYAQEHNNTLPMQPVWDAFDLRMEMLMTVATHLRPTKHSRLHPPEEE